MSSIFIYVPKHHFKGRKHNFLTSVEGSGAMMSIFIYRLLIFPARLDLCTPSAMLVSLLFFLTFTQIPSLPLSHL